MSVLQSAMAYLWQRNMQRDLGETDIESVLQRLDRLTLEESRTTVAETLDVVYGLVNDMQVVMEGTRG